MSQHHTIGKLVLELQVPDRQHAMQLQDKLGAVCRDRLVAVIQELLDSWAGSSSLLRIDRLEIDLGACTSQGLEKDLPEMVLSYLQDRYPSLHQPHAPLETGMERQPVTRGYFDGWLYFLEHGLLPDTSHVQDTTAWEAGALETLATATTAMEKCRQVLAAQPAAVNRMVLQFSRQFIRQWLQAYAGPSQQPIIQMADAWEQYCYDAGILPLLRSNLASATSSLPDRTVFRRKLDEWSIRRILSSAQIPGPALLLEEVMTLTFGAGLLPQYIAALKQQAQLPGTAGTLLSSSLATLYSKYADEAGIAGMAGRIANATETAKDITGNNPLTGATGDNAAPGSSQHGEQPPVAANTKSTATNTNNQEGRSPVDNSQAEEGHSSVFPEAKEQLVEDAAHSIHRDTPQQEQPSPAHKTSADAQQEQPAAKDPLYTDSRVEQRKTPGTPPEGLTTYINNAGLVLLHPYLPILFDAVGLLENRAFKDPAAQDKAVQLLAFLACGETGVPEYELVFPKLLCGLLPGDPVDRFVALTEQDKTEASQLLSAVINNWNALGATSIDGLRGNFLMREGKLQWQWDEWRLRVTQQSYDLLLNRLPWGISVVRLPWMPWMLKTEWV